MNIRIATRQAVILGQLTPGDVFEPIGGPQGSSRMRYMLCKKDAEQQVDSPDLRWCANLADGHLGRLGASTPVKPISGSFVEDP